jgi:hypothetical protein
MNAKLITRCGLTGEPTATTVIRKFLVPIGILGDAGMPGLLSGQVTQ